MDYFAAVQEGRERVTKAVAVLQEVAGPSYPMLFLKLGVSDWTPVGKELLQKVVPGKGKTSALVICDGEGNAKAMSAWLPAEKAKVLAETLESRGGPEFSGRRQAPHLSLLFINRLGADIPASYLHSRRLRRTPEVDEAPVVPVRRGEIGGERMARCSVCKGHAVASCAECGSLVCMSHSTTIFDETSRAMKTYCGNCTAKRMPLWVARRR